MKIWNRQKNIIYEEKEYGTSKLKFLYNTVLGRILLKLIFVSRWYSKLEGLYQHSSLSRKKVKKFIQKYNISMEGYKNKYKSFADFFTRKRIIKNESNSNELCSICDGKLRVYSIDEKIKLNIKNSIYNINEIIQDDELARVYKDGICLVFRLSLTDYHRYLYLDNGEKISSKTIKGKLHTVRPISSKYKVYSTNSRVITKIKTENFGDIIQVEVGAMLVGKINNNNKLKFDKLEEKGYFDYGGSTILLLFQKDKIKIDEDILEKSSKDIETMVICGEKIGEKINA